MAASSGFAISVGVIDDTSKSIARINKSITDLVKNTSQVSKNSASAFDSATITRAAEGMKSFGDQSLGAARAIERMIPGMQLLTAAGSGYGIAKLTQDWAAAGNAIGKTANLLNAPVERISALRGAARLAGSSADAMDTSLQGLNDTLSAANWNRPGAQIALLNNLGIGFHGVGKNARAATDALGDVAEAVTARNNDPDAQKRLLENLGMSPDLIPLLNHGRKGLEDFTKKAETTGGVMTGQMAGNAKEMKSSWEELSLAVEGVGNRIVNSWSGTVTTVIKSSAKWIENNQKVSDNIGQIGTAIMALSLLRPAAWVMKLLGLGTLVPSGPVAAAAAAGVTAPITAGSDMETGGSLVAGPARAATGVFSQWMSNRFGGNGSPARPQAGPRASRALDNQTINRARDMHDRLLAAGIPGMNDNIAWGFAGNSVAESGVNVAPAAGDSGHSHGAMQWNQDRLENYKKRYGHMPEQGNMDEVVDFIRWELANTESQRWRTIRALGSQSPGEAGDIVSREYERPKDVEGEARSRWELSQRLAGAVHVSVDVKHNGTSAVANSTASGAATTAPPRVEGPMYGAGPTYFP